MHGDGRKWPVKAEKGRRWPEMARNCWKFSGWPEIDGDGRGGQKWTGMAGNGLEFARGGRKWLKMAGNGQELAWDGRKCPGVIKNGRGQPKKSRECPHTLPKPLLNDPLVPPKVPIHFPNLI